ncbi:D-alanyl-D-alanine carboxypeptidase family protein [Patescibacteria group bacterium]
MVFRSILLIIIKIGMYILWVLDWVTNFNLKKASKVLLYVLVTFLGIAFSYAIYSDFFSDLAGAFVGDSFHSSNSNIEIYYPVLVRELEEPKISAKSVLVMDRGKSKVLYELNSNEKLAPASTVKLMTALVSLDLYVPQEVLTISEYCTGVEGMKAFFPAESQFLVDDLIYSMLVGSAGDSACALASGKVSEKEFIDLMNKKAKALGMVNTRFSNPVGLDNVNGGHYSTASDLYKLANNAVADRFIRQVVSTNYFNFRSIDGSFGSHLYNTNSLLWQIPGSVGIKTGTTEDAGEVLIYEFKDSEKDLVIIVMGSEDRFYDVRSLLTWVLLSYTWN